MALQRTNMYNVLAGAFLVGGVSLAVGLSFLLSDGVRLEGTRGFVVRFSIRDGAVGLQPGSAVLLGGQQVGKVSKVVFDPDPSGGKPAQSILISVRIRGDLSLYENASVTLERPLLGSVSTLNITSVGDPSSVATPLGKGPTLDEDEQVLGTLAPPAFLSQAGFGATEIDKIKRLVDKAGSTMDRVDQMVQRSAPIVDQTVEDARAIVKTFRDKSAPWSDSIDRSLASVEKASSKVDSLLTKADASVDDARTTIAKIRSLVEETSPKVGKVVDDAGKLVAGLSGESTQLFNQTLRDARETLDRFRQSGEQVNAFLVSELPGVRRTLAGTRQSAELLKLAIAEIGAQPWRLLHRPDTKELAEQLTYDSARAYAEAVTNLRDTAEALEAAQATVTPNAPADGIRVRTVTDLRMELDRAFDRYQETEREFLRRLMNKAADPQQK